jgi:hypothetical protein
MHLQSASAKCANEFHELSQDPNFMERRDLKNENIPNHPVSHYLHNRQCEQMA